jgi:hypothetical protein
MRPNGFTRLTLLVLALLFLGSCASSSQIPAGGAPPEFRRFLGTWVKRSSNRIYAEVFRIKSISSTGEVDIDFKVQRADGYMEDRAFLQGYHVWIKIAEAKARIEMGEPGIHMRFIPDRTYERFRWESYDLFFLGGLDDRLLGVGTQSGQTHGVTFMRKQ